MKRGFFVLMASFIFLSLSGQDIIYKNDGTEIKSSILEITTDVIKYKYFEQPDGPIRNILISDVFMIIYKDGTKEVFKGKQTSNVNQAVKITNNNPRQQSIEQPPKAVKTDSHKSFEEKKGALFLHGGFSTVTGFAGAEYFIGQLSFEGGWAKLTAPLSQETRSTIGLGITLYLFDWYKSGPYATYGFCTNGAVEERGMTIYDTYNNYWVNLNSIFAGYRVIIGHRISLKAGAGYCWSEYTKGVAFEATAGIRIFSNKLKN